MSIKKKVWPYTQSKQKRSNAHAVYSAIWKCNCRMFCTCCFFLMRAVYSSSNEIEYCQLYHDLATEVGLLWNNKSFCNRAKKATRNLVDSSEGKIVSPTSIPARVRMFVCHSLWQRWFHHLLRQLLILNVLLKSLSAVYFLSSSLHFYFLCKSLLNALLYE